MLLTTTPVSTKLIPVQLLRLIRCPLVVHARRKDSRIYLSGKLNCKIGERLESHDFQNFV